MVQSLGDVASVVVVDALRARLDARHHLAYDWWRDGHGGLPQPCFECIRASLARRFLARHTVLDFLPQREAQWVQVRRIGWELNGMYLQSLLSIHDDLGLEAGRVVAFQQDALALLAPVALQGKRQQLCARTCRSLPGRPNPSGGNATPSRVSR
jgi:hypothetical protein